MVRTFSAQTYCILDSCLRTVILRVVGPALEAFGYERIIFGSSLSSSSQLRALSSSEWFELARESFAELGTEQEDLDAVFGGNAKKVYASAPAS